MISSGIYFNKFRDLGFFVPLDQDRLPNFDKYAGDKFKNPAFDPGNTLSRHGQVTLVARLSRSGNPMAQPGDLEGAVADVKVGATGVKIMIDQARPGWGAVSKAGNAFEPPGGME